MENLLLVAAILIAVVFFYKTMKSKRGGRHKPVHRQPAPEPAWVQHEDVGPEYDYQNFLYSNGLEAERFDSHREFVRDTYSDSLLLGSSKDVVRDDINDINPYLGMRRPNYDVFIGSGSRQVPTDTQDQLPKVRAPSFI